ncbi:MAG: CYTH domain-containing protein [Flavobacteriales bacterium]|jgi:adenylate cyclase|tara:strand:- start:1700 stop:2170 length:471 start_codon:yes stop_codon:yes gene_type:complete
MAIEIERKYLLKNDSWKKEVSSKNKIVQGYLNSNPERTVRIRITKNKGFLTIKSKNEGSFRKEFEYEIPLQDAEELVLLCEKPIIEKTRHLVHQGNHIWEIDIFEGENKGLEVAEIELSQENETFLIPSWLGKEVTEKTKYYNSQLIENPFSAWKK